MLKINVPLDAAGNIKSLGPIHGAMAIKQKYDVDVTVDLVPFETSEAIREAELAQANQACDIDKPTFGDLLDQADVINFKSKLKTPEPLPALPEYLSTTEVAKVLGVSASCIYNNKRLRKKLGVVQHGKGCIARYPKTKVDAYVARLV